MPILQGIRQWARRVKRDAVTLWFAYRHPATTWVPKVMAAVVVAYALSPIDLIPDFIPVLGYVDDALLLPALIWVTIRMLPQDVLADCRNKADQWLDSGKAKPRSAWGAALVIAIWTGVTVLLWAWLRRH
ncbi:YkvA family protein [Variovorax sp. J22P240]|uniref:YkvA family protein n=1 Tax=Variovorax sp. J22P240 TaxID=3053514 RepID=UPI002575E191|nr:YkvA family protein [Variovorax sp. J22P240]MDL9997557.1 YkvA family protein [Variovorax sp. J22P240]